MLKLRLFLFIIFPFGLFSQELPPIQTFSPSDYSGENQNWGIAQSSDKFIYIANNHSLLEFDGGRWNKYSSPNGSVIRTVKAVGNKVYMGCYMEFGYWMKNSQGQLTYTSLKDQLSEPLVEDEEFWNIVAVEDWILFQSLNRIYIYSLAKKSFRIIEAKTDKAQIFNLASGVYFQRKDQGVYKITEHGPDMITQDVQIKNETLIGLFEHNEGFVYMTSNAKFYISDLKGSLVPWDIPALSHLTSLNIYSSLQLKDGSMVLGTISNGIYQISKEGELILKVNQQTGLNNNTTLTIFEDQDSNLWLGHDYGLSVINLDSHFNEYIDKVGKLGVVYASMVSGNKLYLGTNQGLFWTELKGDPDFKLIKGTEGQVWCLTQIKGDLFCGHHNGTYLIKGNQPELISDFPGTWDVKPIEGETDYLLQGNYNGLSILQKIDSKWKFRNALEGFDNSSRFFEFSAKDEIFVNHEYKGVFRLKLENDFQGVKVISQEVGKGIASSLVKFKDEIIYATIHAVFTMNTEKQFVVDSSLTDLFDHRKQDALSILMKDPLAERLWRFGKQDILFISSSKFDDGYRRTIIALPADLRNNLGVSGFENISNVGDDEYLIGSSNGYVTLNLKKLKPRKYNIYLNEIKKYHYNKPPESIAMDSVAKLKNNESNLYFSYAVPEFEKYAAVEYQYKLNGLYENWSSWSTASEVSFENLPFGDYEFVARAKVGNTMTENEIAYAFTIARPWYWSTMAIVLYIMAILGLSFIVHKFYKAHYRKQQEKIVLENKRKLKRKKNKAKRKIVQIKNENLKREIEAKSRELAVSTMSLIKKNEFLNSLKDRLRQAENTSQMRSVIKMIDHNIDNEDDWKLFEEAFNNADKNFLKKIKELHPDLTPNDLRLCAYLRLNLSSKEIAPLLNISVKSVEVKRYRLRKKMDLEHEKGLTEYLLSL